ncbi:MAG TPA: hypothetical protein VNN19_09285, partial [bacterium]|nr:hypothetical protein [bacterium]
MGDRRGTAGDFRGTAEEFRRDYGRRIPWHASEDMLRLWKRLTLLQRFTLASATIAVALGLVLVTATIRAIESFAVKDEAQVAAELVLRAVGTQLRPADLRGPLAPARRDLLDALFRAHGISDRSLRIRLWRADGQL